MVHFEHIFIVQELISYIWKVSKCGAGERWTYYTRKDVEHRNQGEEEYYTQNRRKEGNYSGHNLSRKCLLKHVIEIKIEGRVDNK